MYNGNPTAERVRTRDGAVRRLVKLFSDLVPLEQVALLHTHAVERAEALLQQVKHLLPEGKVLKVELNPVMGVHVGPGAIGFVCIVRG